MSIQSIAEAFSGHRFAEAYPHLADDVRWDLVGADRLKGREAVVAACEQTAAGLAHVTATFESFRSVVGDRVVVVDATGRYVDANGEESRVASCDLLDFDGETIVAIRSYTMELPLPPG